LQTEQSNTDDFGIRLRFNEEKTEISKCNPNVVRAIVDFWCLMPLSAIFQLYHGDQF
jgi:hypothetical protein